MKLSSSSKAVLAVVFTGLIAVAISLFLQKYFRSPDEAVASEPPPPNLWAMTDYEAVCGYQADEVWGTGQPSVGVKDVWCFDGTDTCLRVKSQALASTEKPEWDDIRKLHNSIPYPIPYHYNTNIELPAEELEQLLDDCGDMFLVGFRYFKNDIVDLPDPSPGSKRVVTQTVPYCLDDRGDLWRIDSDVRWLVTHNFMLVPTWHTPL